MTSVLIIPLKLSGVSHQILLKWVSQNFYYLLITCCATIVYLRGVVEQTTGFGGIQLATSPGQKERHKFPSPTELYHLSS